MIDLGRELKTFVLFFFFFFFSSICDQFFPKKKRETFHHLRSERIVRFFWNKITWDRAVPLREKIILIFPIYVFVGVTFPTIRSTVFFFNFYFFFYFWLSRFCGNYLSWDTIVENYLRNFVVSFYNILMNYIDP